MSSSYYKPCAELDKCNELIDKYWQSKQYDKCFAVHLALAEKGYPLAECQVGYFYLEGYGTSKDANKAFYWTERAAQHGDWDGQYNLASLYEEGIGTNKDIEKAKYWYKKAAEQNHALAIDKCKEYNIKL